VEAKAVYIPYNSNRNPSGIAKVFFESKADLEIALKKGVYYYNTKLYWKMNNRFNNEKQIGKSYNFQYRKNNYGEENTRRTTENRKIEKEETCRNSRKHEVREIKEIPDLRLEGKEKEEDKNRKSDKSQESKNIVEKLRRLQEDFNNLNSEFRVLNEFPKERNINRVSEQKTLYRS
jgi:hypothetical protein